jgi:hypothetical protein
MRLILVSEPTIVAIKIPLLLSGKGYALALPTQNSIKSD